MSVRYRDKGHAITIETGVLIRFAGSCELMGGFVNSTLTGVTASTRFAVISVANVWLVLQVVRAVEIAVPTA